MVVALECQPHEKHIDVNGVLVKHPGSGTKRSDAVRSTRGGHKSRCEEARHDGCRGHGVLLEALMVGRAGIEPAQLSRRFYRPLSPPMPIRPTPSPRNGRRPKDMVPAPGDRPT